MSQANAIETEGLSKTFRARWSGKEVQAVKSVSLQIAAGSTFGLLGANGAGKTTFVKMLLSATHPTAGRAQIFGLDVRQPSSRLPIGYLPENHRFPTYFTGEGMLDLYASLSGVDSATRRRLIPDLLEKVGLRDWGTVRLSKYSKGMLQRVGLAQALIHAPRLLILDEPSDGVDPVGRRHIREILHALELQGVTIFINSHLLAEVELFCREVAILKNGALVLQGKVKDLTAGKGYRLTTAALPDNLRTELAAKATSMQVKAETTELTFTERKELNLAIDAVRAAECEIESVIPTISTLEDVFVRTVEGEKQ